MLIRIVKLTLKKENIASFEQIFEETKDYIRNFEGCCSLELYQDRANSNIFFTYSHWENEENLEKYRKSDFFRTVWGKTKLLFEDKAEAWSVNRVKSVK
ncbi:antibiotic biosynthesis monooxygenase family protein [uncultured Eudoraea sp.]|uniref:putative quinol monooxygenase n=1 Tax=uncultured Eudoraea sp. TaxID=1035614 RepID=UPI00262E3590|nr:antibiotic biosynthesis monooxygenase family protein [uncultured Eudoraea sp.]